MATVLATVQSADETPANGISNLTAKVAQTSLNLNSTQRRKAEWDGEFTTLGPDLLENVIRCLPAVSLERNRLVCREWNKIITNRNFLQRIWSKERPDESWIILHSASIRTNGVLLFNSSRKNWPWLVNVYVDGALNIHEPWECKILPVSVMGLVFLLGCVDGQPISIVASNPFSGAVRKLPNMKQIDEANPQSMLVVCCMEDPATRSYQILVISLDKEELRLIAECYNSKDNLWKQIAEPPFDRFVTRLLRSPLRGHSNDFTCVQTLHALRRFCNNDGMCYFFPKLRADSELLFYIPFVTYDSRKNRWREGFLQPPHVQEMEACVPKYSTFYMFERGGDLVVAIMSNDCKMWRGAQIWSLKIKDRENQQERGDAEWKLLATMPPAMFRNIHPCGDECTLWPWNMLANSETGLIVFSLPNRRQGDQLVFMSVVSHEMVSFNFSTSSEKNQWKVLGFPSTVEQRCSVRDSDVPQKLRLNGRSSRTWWVNPGSMRMNITDGGLSFEPRWDVDP